MQPYTYRDLIRKYAEDVLKGRADVDLTARQRRYCGFILNAATNTLIGAVYYPPTDMTRNEQVQALFEVVHNARLLLTNAESRDLDVAAHRATEILRNI